MTNSEKLIKTIEMLGRRMKNAGMPMDRFVHDSSVTVCNAMTSRAVRIMPDGKTWGMHVGRVQTSATQLTLVESVEFLTS